MSFLEIFQPGLRHLREERERQKLMVARPPAAGPAPLGIDLDGGTAVIPAAHPTGPVGPEADRPEADRPEADRPEADRPEPSRPDPISEEAADPAGASAPDR